MRTIPLLPIFGILFMPPERHFRYMRSGAFVLALREVSFSPGLEAMGDNKPLHPWLPVDGGPGTTRYSGPGQMASRPGQAWPPDSWPAAGHADPLGGAGSGRQEAPRTVFQNKLRPYFSHNFYLFP